jgi:hypothetical protein
MRVLKKSIWPHQVILKPVNGSVDDRVVWLKEKMPQDRWYILGPERYCFKRQEDAVMFSLRWA